MRRKGKWPLLLAIIWGAAVLLLCPAASAPAPGDGDSARELSDIRSRMEKEKAALSVIMKQQGNVLEKLLALKSQLIRSEQRLQKLEKEREILAADSEELAQSMKGLTRKLERQRAATARRLRARYRFGQTGALSVLWSAESMADLSRRARYLDAVFVADRSRLADYNSLLTDWRAAEDRLRARQESLKALEGVAREQRGQLNEEKLAQTDLLRRVREEKSAHESMLSELSAAAARLSGVIAGLSRDSGVKEGDSAGPAETAGFAALRGRLCYPAPGPVLTGFGRQIHPKFNTVIMQNGIEIGAAGGAAVRAVAPGVARFADWFRGYGNLVIIDHGQGYYTVYAHLAEIRAQAGASVAKGSVIGTVGDTGSLAGPSLYFEIRYHEKPLDPALWLSNCSG